MVDKSHSLKGRDKERRKMIENRRRRKWSAIKKVHELGEFPGLDAWLIICINGRYTTYSSNQREPPSTGDIVSH